jgi:hypothetical protein
MVTTESVKMLVELDSMECFREYVRCVDSDIKVVPN